MCKCVKVVESYVRELRYFSVKQMQSNKPDKKYIYIYNSHNGEWTSVFNDLFKTLIYI